MPFQKLDGAHFSPYILPRPRQLKDAFNFPGGKKNKQTSTILLSLFVCLFFSSSLSLSLSLRKVVTYLARGWSACVLVIRQARFRYG